jgi:transposase-like protein
MYVQGVSARKIKAINEKLCGISVSSTQDIKVTVKLD